MPLEGQWKRVNTPLRKLSRRERSVAIISAVVVLVAVLALVLATVGDSRPGPKPGCIYAIVPGVMGATAVDACGAQAKKTCTQHADPAMTDPVSVGVRKSCRRAGLL
ncbi:MAG TPA: hypothetical protein VGF74_09360 [Thermoleophilaceae bacterium]|jgi:hypothetical protein